MPFYVNVVLSFLVMLVWIERLKDRLYLFQHFLSWPLVIGVGFQCLVLTPIQTFQFRFSHDWALSYLFDPDLHPAVDSYLTLWTFLAALTTIGACLGAYAIARIPFAKVNSRAPRYALFAALFVLAVLTALLWPELLHIGEYNEFFAGEGRFLFASFTGALGVCEVLFCGGFLYYGPRIIERIPKESSNLG